LSSTGRRLGQREGAPFHFGFDGREIEAWPGESVAAALLAAGETVLRREGERDARGLLCAIGVCWECRLTIDGEANRRACMTEAAPGMCVASHDGRNG
jgi:predicted molibdopterin-dependent oxidoreductase YjgC